MSEVAVDPLDVTSLAADNARLRTELIAENEKLKAALAASSASGLTFQGLSDEDIRRLEHPEEFAHETLLAQLQDLHARAQAEGVSLDAQVTGTVTPPPAEVAAPAAV